MLLPDFFFEKYLQVSDICRKFAYQFIKKENNMENKYMEDRFGNLGIGVKIVSDFPHKANDSSILYGVDLDGQKKGGVEMVKESPYDTEFYIFRYDGKYGVGYTVQTPQTQYEPADSYYEELKEMYKTWDEAENKLIEMIQNRGEAMEDPDF